MELDLTKFLVCYAIAGNADPDAPQATTLALATSLLDMSLVQSAVVTQMVAQSLAPGQKPVAQMGSVLPAAPFGSRPRFSRLRGRRARAMAARARVKVPSVRHMANPADIHTHLHEHKLRPVIHREQLAEIKEPRVLRQWPEAGADVMEGTEVNVLLIVPEEHERGEPARTSGRK
jgi:hypothetical protein